MGFDYGRVPGEEEREKRRLLRSGIFAVITRGHDREINEIARQMVYPVSRSGGYRLSSRVRVVAVKTGREARTIGAERGRAEPYALESIVHNGRVNCYGPFIRLQFLNGGSSRGQQR